MKAFFLMLVYGALYVYGYVNIISPLFGYAGYDFFPKSWYIYAYTIFMCTHPNYLIRNNKKYSSEYTITVFYLIFYFPVQLTLSLIWNGSLIELFFLQFNIYLSQIILIKASKTKLKLAFYSPKPKTIKILVLFFTLVSCAVLFANYGSSMRLVSFQDVYDLRLKNESVSRGALSNYSIMLLNYLFIPYFYANFFIKKNIQSLLIAILASLFIYMSIAAKTSALMFFIVLVFYLTSKAKRTDIFILKRLIPFLLVVIFLIPNEGPFFILKSIILVRTLAVGGWTINMYYEYFTTNEYTFYGHIRPVNAIFNNYPYGNISLGQLIGLENSGSIEANFNAGFWASDGIAAIGIPGILFITVFISAILVLINSIKYQEFSKFNAVWLSGVWLGIMNLPISVVLLSTGLLLFFLMMYYKTIIKYLFNAYSTH